ncbi:MAG TPA: hypothetical protein VGZ69_02905 [Candidatus Rhabdochlamydia sp.]|jgi:hypothetical protein|nr:hypothetical protein [Candidatus Rhabdochlamydia sp.]
MANANISLDYIKCFSQVEDFITKQTQEKIAEAEALEKVLKSSMKLISLFSNPSSQKQVDFLEDEKKRNYFNQLFIYNPSLIGQLHPNAGYNEQQCKDIANALKEGNLDAIPSALYLFDTKDFSRIIDILNNEKELIPNKISQKTSEVSHKADNMTDFSRMATKALEKEDRFKARMVGNQRV